MVPPYSHRVSRVRRYSGYSLLYLNFRLQDSHSLWWAFPCPSTSQISRYVSPNPRNSEELLVWPSPRSLATTSGISVDVFSSSYLDVSVQTVPHVHLCIQYTLIWYCHIGFPHSEISGSKRMCRSPKLIAACRVLHRLLMPRHSPCALFRLTYYWCSC